METSVIMRIGDRINNGKREKTIEEGERRKTVCGKKIEER